MSGPNYTDLLVQAARAVEWLVSAEDCAYAVDESHDLPRHAATAAWDAAANLRSIANRFLRLADAQAFAARRYERAQHEEDRSGVAYRAGGDEAA
jgi:hypothetical protein